MTHLGTDPDDIAMNLIQIFKLRTHLRGILQSDYDKHMVALCSLNYLRATLESPIASDPNIALAALALGIDVINYNTIETISMLNETIIRVLHLLKLCNGDADHEHLKKAFNLLALKKMQTTPPENLQVLKEEIETLPN